MNFKAEKTADNELKLTFEAYKNEVTVWVEGGDASLVAMGGNRPSYVEYSPLDDDLYGIYVLDRNRIRHHSLNEIMLQAERQYDGLMGEIEAEERAEEAMARELASPYLTGRV